MTPPPELVASWGICMMRTPSARAHPKSMSGDHRAPTDAVPIEAEDARPATVPDHSEPVTGNSAERPRHDIPPRAPDDDDWVPVTFGS